MMTGRLEWPDPTPDGPADDVPCPVCAGAGIIIDFDGCRDWCDECGASGEVSPARADDLAREVASRVSYDFYAEGN